MDTLSKPDHNKGRGGNRAASPPLGDVSNLSMPEAAPSAGPQPMARPDVHAVLVGILSDVVQVCEANDIDYCLIGGGLLGIARHDGGFVPWDDDLDIAIWYCDMPRFVSAMEALPAHLAVRCKSTSINPPYEVMDVRTKTSGGDPLHGGHLSIDLVPMMHWRSMRWVRLDDALARASRMSTEWSHGGRFRRVLKSLLVGARVPEAAGWLRERLLYPRLGRHDLACRRTGRGVVTSAYGRHWVGRYPHDVVYPLRTASFCGVAVAVPRDLHRFLTLRYGADYMEIPPPSARWTHFQRALWVGQR